MKLAKCLLVLFCLLMICETTEAQLFRGRFMQKIRDDLSGASRQKAEQQRALADQARRKQLELAQQRQKAAQARAGAKTPTPARLNTRQQSAHNQRSPQRAPQQQRPTNTNRNTAGSSSDKHRYQKAQATGVPKFGMTVTENKDGVLVITQVHPRGNAAQAGIRPGDVVAEIGSVEPGSKKEYESIVDIMSEGDQMEFVISRRGKENTLMVQFGDLPEKIRNAEQLEDELGPAIVDDTPSRNRSSRSSVDFAPQDTRRQSTGMDSVIDRAQYNRRPTGSQLSPQDQEIMRLRAEIERLRRSQTPTRSFAPSREPVGPRIGQ